MAIVDVAMAYKTVIVFLTYISNLCVNTLQKIALRYFIVNHAENTVYQIQCDCMTLTSEV